MAADAATAVARLPFLDSLDRRNDFYTLTHFMILLRHGDPVEARRFLANPGAPRRYMAGGRSLGCNLESQGQEMATAVKGMPWMPRWD